MRNATAAAAAASVGAVLMATALTGCGAAAGSIPRGDLGVTARDAFVEARSIARAWDAGARLRYVEGLRISPLGVALPDEGEWLFHYTAPGQTQELLVRVAPLETGSEERPVTSPPGYVIGDNALGASWIDSPAPLASVSEAREGSLPETASLLLVPTRPEQWVIRFPDSTERWRVHGETGEVLGS